MCMVDPIVDTAGTASQSTRTVVHLHSNFMTQAEINRCEDELKWATPLAHGNIEPIKAHRDFLNGTLTKVIARRAVFPLWFVYRFFDRLLVKPLPDEVRYAPKYY